MRSFANSPHTNLGAEYLPVFKALQDYFDATMAWQDLSKEDKAAAAPELIERYLNMVAELPQTNAHVIPKTSTRLAMVEGGLRVLHLSDTVVGKHGILDTIPTKTLSHFVTDFRDAEGDRAQATDQLFNKFDISGDDRSRVGEDLEAEFVELQLRTAIVDQLLERFKVPDGVDVASLFEVIFPGTELDVIPDLIGTSTGLMFCLPFANIEELPEDHPRRVFHTRVTKVRQRDMQNFPAFGAFRGEQANEAVIREIASKIGSDHKSVCDALSTMITVLAVEEVDKYIVHDVWGHQWQALLFKFEHTYQATARYVNLPELDEAVEGMVFGEVLRSLVGAEDGYGTWANYLDAELDHRVITTTSGLFAEVLADAVEYKFLQLRPDLAHLMPSSSFLKEFPAKLDLTLHDLPLYVRFAVRAWTRFAERPDRQAKLAQDLLAAYPELDAAEVKKTVEQVASWTAALLKPWSEVYEYELKDGQIQANPIAHFALQFFEITVALNATLERLYAASPQPGQLFALPVDLFIFCVAAFYEQDRSQNFWLVDEFVRDYEPPVFV